ncbi:hypothetical protein MMC07_002283 [Pseudocyphellaria aurata]|nr:hypothetical protein [Pseudocyphellaria aurata]
MSFVSSRESALLEQEAWDNGHGTSFSLKQSSDASQSMARADSVPTFIGECLSGTLQLSLEGFSDSVVTYFQQNVADLIICRVLGHPAMYPVHISNVKMQLNAYFLHLSVDFVYVASDTLTLPSKITLHDDEAFWSIRDIYKAIEAPNGSRLKYQCALEYVGQLGSTLFIVYPCYVGCDDAVRNAVANQIGDDTESR